jgi:deoxycytidine triphosphate deaminase
LEIQLQPASFDLTLGEVYLLTSSGSIDFSNKERKLPKYKKIEFKKDWLKLKRGTYLIVFNEIVKMPNDLDWFFKAKVKSHKEWCFNIFFPLGSRLSWKE